MDLYNGILCCGFLCAHLISVSLFRLPRRGLPRPTDTLRLPRRGLPRPCRYIQANRLPRLQGYYTRATTLHTDFWGYAGYHTYLQVVFSCFSFHRLIRQCFHNNNNNFSTEPGAHRTDPLSLQVTIKTNLLAELKHQAPN